MVTVIRQENLSNFVKYLYTTIQIKYFHKSRVLCYIRNIQLRLYIPFLVLFTDRPEELSDRRSLYEQLQEQKEKKQEEWDEQFKFSKQKPSKALLILLANYHK